MINSMLKNALSVCTLRPLLLVMPFMLSACSGLSPSDLSRSSPGPDVEYMGWHCEGVTEGEAESSDNWSCSETLLRDGLVLSETPRADQVEASVENALIAKAPTRKASVKKAPIKRHLLKKHSPQDSQVLISAAVVTPCSWAPTAVR